MYKNQLPILTSALRRVESAPIQRRSLLKFAGVSLAATALSAFAGRSVFAQVASGGIDLGSGDIGVLNYAYALEQLEAAFYTLVTKNFYGGASGRERALLSDIHAHEVAHREFLKGALGGAAIPKLEFDFSTVNFRDRQSVLTTARTFEDTGVSAYNGAGQLLRDPNHLLAAGRIVSVEARHAATLRDILQPRSAAFAGDDIVDSFGLGAVDPPSTVLKTVAPFIRTPITANNLPKP
ncbi:MAG: hypothetical protein DLM52_10005 [Chthoniobacterales bacterium]|nr:MAG: hypothetical protein DLM52_10005 [Chthoniobacterales bacterium]